MQARTIAMETNIERAEKQTSRVMVCSLEFCPQRSPMTRSDAALLMTTMSMRAGVAGYHLVRRTHCAA
jgi:hypothetical protein